MDDVTHDILNMFKSKETLKIPMLRPSHQKQISNDMSLLNEGLYRRTEYDAEEERSYIKEYQQKADEEYLKLTNMMSFNKHDDMSEITESSENCKEDKAQIYRIYNFAYRPKINLPVLDLKDKITSMISNNPVVIIRGSTGCGKTTQIPQFILNAEFEKQRYCNIIVTQPRRIATLSIAKRVSQEREWPVGTLVGFEMGLVKNTCPDTRITYCTTGVLLNRLTNKKHMMDYTHVILDEVHERDEDMDFLLLIVKKLLRKNSATVKVILMSATFDVEKFATYFSTPVDNEFLPAPIIDIPKGSCYNVSIYYLDEMESLGDIPEVLEHEPKFTPDMIEFCIRMIYIFDRIDVKRNESGVVCERSAVLIFLPGIYEIEDLYTQLTSLKHVDMKWNIIILHSLISTEDQEKIFKKPPKNYRHIILSTNIAESSITVPDVKYVIDFCMTKLLITEPGTNYQSLELCWASKTNCQQRAGRTGRVMDGRVYRMVPRSFYDTALPDEATPEMLRIPLENTFLKLKMLDMGEPKALFALSLDPPNLSNLRSTVLLLKEVGALRNTQVNVEDHDGELTPLGRVMASIPLSVHVSKLIVLGHIFGILQDSIIIAASMTVKNIFSIRFQEKESAYYEKLYWAADSESDSLASLNAFKVWRKEKTNKSITNAREENEWARRNGLRVKSLREIDALVAELTYKLRFFGIKEYMDPVKQFWENHYINHTFILKIIIAGAFYPNYFIKSTDDSKNLTSMLSKCDPTNTIALNGWPLKQFEPLHSKRLKKIFAQHLNIKRENLTTYFDGVNIYVKYEKNHLANDNNFVRYAIKMRQCKVPIEIDIVSNEASDWDDNSSGVLDRTSSSTHKSSYASAYDDKQLYSKFLKDPAYPSKVVLHGPFSPIELKLGHMASAGALKSIRIEPTSVNSVLLDNSSEKESRGALLVAQTINQDSRNMINLFLRNTTLLPNMSGLTTLIILIFTPYMELRRDLLGIRYTGALCGLGYDHSKEQSIFPEHDLANIFDIEITMEDLQVINKLRHWMNVAMYFNPDADEQKQKELTVNCQNQIKNTFSEVIYKFRKPQVITTTSSFYKWNRYDETLFLESARDSVNQHVYCLHKALELNERNEELEDTITHLLQLERLACEDPNITSMKSTSCKLCLTEVRSIIDLRVHLCSDQHKTNEQMINTTANFGEDIQNLLTNMRL